MDENIEGLLTYVLGWLTGIVFLVIEKKSKFVRFHAMQSTITFISLTMLYFIFVLIPFVGAYLAWLVDIIALIIWIVCMIKAYQGEKYKLPVFGDIAARYV